MEVDGEAQWGHFSSADPDLASGNRTQRLELVAKSDGKVTIYARSNDFDVLLRIETLSGDELTSDDDGGVGTNARVTPVLKKGKAYAVLVGAKPGGSGWYWVECRQGEPPPPPPEALRIAAVAFHDTQARTALSRGESRAAAEHFEKKGTILRQQAELDGAKGAWEAALAQWAELGEKKSHANAALELGRIDCDRKEWAGARARFTEALAEYRALADVAGETHCLLAMAEGSAAAGDPKAAAASYGEALAAADKAGDLDAATKALSAIAVSRHAAGDRSGEAQALARLGDLLRSRRSFEKARECHRKACELAQGLKDKSAEGAAWSDLGLDWLGASEWTHARECFQSALEIARASADRLAEADALGNLGRTWYDAQDYARALTFHQQQLAAASGNADATRRAQLRTGMCCMALRDYALARTCLEAALDSARAAEDASAESDALLYLSFLEMQAGNLEKWEELRKQAFARRDESVDQALLKQLVGGRDLYDRCEFSKAQAIFEACLAESESRQDRRLKMEVLLWLGQCHEHRGRYADAIRCFSEMVDLARALGHLPDEGEGLDRLGVQYRAVGALDQAMESLSAALAIAQEIRDPYLQLNVLNDIGNVWLAREQYDLALEAYGKLRTLARSIHMDLPDVAGQNNQGVTYWYSDRFAESQQSLEEAVQATKEMNIRAYHAEFSGNLARTLAKVGDRSRARELAVQSLKEVDALDAVEPRVVLIPLEALTAIAIGEEDARGAKQWLERAKGLLEGLRVQAQGAPGDVGVDPWLLCPPWDRHTQDLVRLQDAQEGIPPADRKELLVRGFREADGARARELTRGIVEHRRGIRKSAPMGVRADWMATLARLDDDLKAVSSAIRQGRPSAEVDRLQQAALAQRRRAEELEGALRELSPKGALLDLPQGASPADIRKAGWTKSCALVEYTEGDEELYAYVLTETDLVLLDLGKRRAADQAVERYLALIGSPPGSASAADIAHAGRALFESLLAAPLAAAGEHASRLLIVPTPSLAVLPFDALVVSAQPAVRSFADMQFVIERCEVDYCPSAAILLTLETSAAGTQVKKVLVLADPVYPSEVLAPQAAAPKSAAAHTLLTETRGPGDALDPRAQAFGRLVKTREEALAIADEFVEPDESEAKQRLDHLRIDTARSGPLHARKLDLYLGTDASREKLAGDLQPYAILHLAAHGFVDGQFPQKTGIALSGSGTTEYTGFFTIADAIGLDLEANLVVLSACETARGKVRAGEGVESMASAFLQAGAHRVVASLWQVADWVASDTMKSFYWRILHENKMPAEALHAAKLEMRRGTLSRGVRPGVAVGGDAGNPNSWAPFIHMGSPR